MCGQFSDNFRNSHKIPPYQTASSSHNFTSRAGLVVPAELIKCLELSERVDQAMPKPEEPRIQALDDIQHFHADDL